MRTKIAIIGGGIIGTYIARELSRYDCCVTLLEREADLAFGATKANTGIIHAGYDDDPNTIKAKLCVQGNALWPETAGELGVPLKRVGSLVIALKEDEVHVLKELKERGTLNRVPHLQVIEDSEQLVHMEPKVNEEAVAALYAPTASITSPYEMAIALGENARLNSVKMLLETNAEEIMVEEGQVRGIRTNKGRLETDYIVNAAGLFSDQISAMAGITFFSMIPIKGEYILFDKQVNLVEHVLFPAPTPMSKGIVATQTVDGNLLIGPNAISISDRTDHATSSSGLHEVFEGARKLIPQLVDNRDMIIHNFAGLRAESSIGDFIIGAYEEPQGFINVAGIKSPGLTSAPAIARMVITILTDQGLELLKKENFNPHRNPIPKTIEVIEKTPRQYNTRNPFLKDPRYGHIICRCEHVSEGEIVEAIRRGARTLDGIKFRTRAGMGRCQGGFCTPHLLRILSNEEGIALEEITKRGGRSNIVPYRVKALLKGGRE